MTVSQLSAATQIAEYKILQHLKINDKQGYQ